MNVLRGVLCSFVLLTAVVASGEDQTQPDITFSSRSELVLVPVVVADKSGEHVPGLTKDVFEIQENGKSKPVATFEEVKTATSRLSRLTGQSDIYSNELNGDQGPKRLTIFALDMVNTPFLDQTFAREQLIKFLANRLDSREPTAVIAIKGNGIRVLHDFSSDPAVLLAALKRVSGELPSIQGLNASEISAEVEELSSFVQGNGIEAYVMLAQREAILATLESFQHVAEAFAGVPGRKCLVWATASFPFGLDPVTGRILSPRVFSQGQIQNVGSGMDVAGNLPALPSSTDIRSGEELKSLEPVYQRTLQMLDEANISVYPIDARGLVVFFPGANVSRIQGLNSFNQAIFESTRDTMVGFADMTGGKAFYNRNDLDVAFQKAADDSASYYMLGYYLDKKAKPGWNKLQVKVKRSGIQVRARNGFFVMPPSKQADTERMDLRMALVSPLPYTGVPLSVRWKGVEAAGAKRKVHFQIDLPPNANLVDTTRNNLLNLEIVAVARTATAQPTDQFSQHLEANLKPDNLQLWQREGLNYNNELIVPPGEYSVRFVVRDNLSGRMGSVTAPLKVTP